MIFSKNSRKAPHLLSLLVAFAVAVGMWYVVSVRDRLEVQLEVGIEYNGIPSGLVVTDGLVSKVQVRLRGPEILLRSISSRSLTEAINLSNIKKGTTIVPLTSDNMGPSLRAFELVDVQPPRIVITADTLAERSVPIRAVLESPLRSGALTVENVTVSPASVTLRGPEGVISSINNLPLGIRLDPPSLVTSNPASVKVQYTITSGRTVVSRRCKISVEAQNASQFTVEPSHVEVMVEVPEALARNSSYLKRLEVMVVPPALEPGQKGTAEPRIQLPEGMTILNPSFDSVTITRKK
ncbi:CdaR family protein [Desulfovibrio sp.]|uniref:CdaR family protein n=1 Tax=Desulfovibrio sp. TaxID=885 RepID=UPI0030796237